MRLLLTLALTLIVTTGCNLVYKQSVQQGNAIEQEDLDKLRIGMTRNQVSFLLGTPAIRDPFHQDRWDYVSSFSHRGGEAVTRKVTLRFENGTLSEMIGVENAESIAGETDDAPDSSTAEVDAERDAGEETPTPATITPLVAPEAAEAAFEEAPEVIEAEAPGMSEDVATNVEQPSTVESGEAETTPAATSAAEPAGSWVIQLGAFDSPGNARAMLERLQRNGIEAEIVERSGLAGTRYLVRQYGIASRTEAERLLEDIASDLGINGFLVPAED